MNIADFEKFTYEKFLVDCDFEKDLATGEELVLASCDIKIYDEDGVDRTSVLLVTDSMAVETGEQTNSKLQAKMQAGTADSIYTVKFYALTSVANKFQADRTVYVKYENVGS